MINMQLSHEHLARLRCVMRAATARHVDAPDQVVMFAVPCVVSDFYRRVKAGHWGDASGGGCGTPRGGSWALGWRAWGELQPCALAHSRPRAVRRPRLTLTPRPARSSGDLFDALFKPHSGGRLARPRAMPEPVALHYTWQLIQAVSCLHAQSHFHRDLKARARARAGRAAATPHRHMRGHFC
jgi:hypothetical protein